MSSDAKSILGIIKQEFEASGCTEITVSCATHPNAYSAMSAFDELKDLGYISWFAQVLSGVAVRVNADRMN